MCQIGGNKNVGLGWFHATVTTRAELETVSSHFPSGDDVWVKSSHNFATTMEVVATIANMLVAFATNGCRLSL